MTTPARTGYTRMLAARWLVDRCDLRAPGTPVNTGSGGTTAGTPVVTEAVPCRLARTGTRAVQATFSEQLLSGADWALYLARDQDCGAGWTITHQGATYTTIAVAADATGAAYTIALLRAQRPVPQPAGG